MLVEVVQRLSRGGYVKQDLLEGKDEELRLKAEHIRPILDTMSGTQLMGITEFGRSVHAEMAAVSDAAKRGLPIRGCTLYTTTFPCHNCAKHIVASGIRRVVYVEPYPKSLAGDLYPDSISIDGETAEGRVPFENFVGISPTRYDEFFSMPERKDDSGNKRNWSARDAVPRFTLIGSEEGYLPREKRASRNFTSLLIRTGFAKGLI
jgi:cytidine deaminase